MKFPAEKKRFFYRISRCKTNWSCKHAILPAPCRNPYEKNAFYQNSAFLCRALAPKPFEIQIWDWSRMKENSKIFQIILTKKFSNIFFLLILQLKIGCGFFLSRVVF